VPPLANAVRLVDGEQAQQPALLQGIELRQHARGGQTFRRDVEHDQPAVHHFPLDALHLVERQRGIQEGGMHAGFLQRADLIVHQRDQRADDNRQTTPGAVPGDRRNLVAQTLAATGRH